MIEIQHIAKAYGSKDNTFPVLKDLSLQLPDGNFTVILGPSGSGKSTLLNVISGLERPDSGTIRYDDTDITALSDKALTQFRRDNVGFIFQQYYLLPNLTVGQNVKMGADLASNKDYRAIIEAVGLTDKMNKFPRELSGGEQQRVSIARALAKSPKSYSDEPTAHDEETGRLILDYMRQIFKPTCTSPCLW